MCNAELTISYDCTRSTPKPTLTTSKSDQNLPATGSESVRQHAEDVFFQMSKNRPALDSEGDDDDVPNVVAKNAFEEFCVAIEGVTSLTEKTRDRYRAPLSNELRTTLLEKFAKEVVRVHASTRQIHTLQRRRDLTTTP
jgi:hypothetical protein